MNKIKYFRIFIFALAAHGKGLSGSDRIFIEFSKYLSKIYPVTIYLCEEGYLMCQRLHLDSQVSFLISKMDSWKKFGFMVNYFARIVEAIRIGLILRLENSPNTIIYSASEFWMDSLPCWILKLRFPKIQWVAAWYQTAPSPWKGFAEGTREQKHYLSTLIYWLMQLPIKPIIQRFADFVFVNNEDERKQFSAKDKRNRVVVVLGAVDLSLIKNLMKDIKKEEKIYDGVFQGRFHPQKGVVELIDIWKLVVDKKPYAKLALIGDGPLMEEVEEKIRKLNLQENITLFGYVFDGVEKYRIFAQSKVVLHPAFYDSGGMASAEAMALGLPAVGFNLKSYESYYPKGMAKVKIGDLESFADKILELLSNGKLYKKISKEATELINYKWSWEYRSREILNQVLEYPSI